MAGRGFIADGVGTWISFMLGDVAELREYEVVVDGVRSPVLEAGDPDANEAVVFIHGNPGTKRDFEALLATTGEFARAVAFDVPGFGDADKPRDFGYDVFNIGIHLANLFDELGIGRRHLVGHDFGAPFAIAVAAFDPAKVGSITLVNAGIMRGYRWHKWARIWRTRGLGEIAMQTTTRTMFGRSLGRLPKDFVDEMYRCFDARTRRAVLELYRATNPGDASLVPSLRALNLPARVIWGARDPFVGVEYAKSNLEAFPSAEVHVIDDAGHWPFIEQPEKFEAALIPFLEERLGTFVPASS